MDRLTALWNRGWIGKLAIGLGGLVIACCVLGLFARRTPAPNQAANVPAAQQIAAALPTNAPAATEAPKPTAVPTPSNTPAPTNTPKPTEPPTATPSPTPLPEPVKLSGTGKVVTDKFIPPGSVSRVTFTHSGKRNFAVTVYDADGATDLLVNTIGNYQGQNVLFGKGERYFEIDADGPWTATIEATVRVDAPIVSLKGHGDTVSDAFDPPASGPVPYTFTHTGERNFAIILYCASGQDLVENEIGAVNDQAVVRFGDGPCLWQISADGDWSIAPK